MIYRPIRYEQMMNASEGFNVRARRMSDGMGVYTGEAMFAFLKDDDIGLKLAPGDLAQALNIPGAELFRKNPNAEPMKDYVKLPEEVLDDYEQFSKWVQKSAAYVRDTCVATVG